MNDPQTPVALDIQYAKEKGEGIAYGGILVAAALLLFGTAKAPVFAVLGAIFLLGVAFYHWPYVARDRRAVEISPRGIVVDRLGLIPWNAVSGIEIVDRYVRLIRNAELRVTLRRPLDAAVENRPETGLFRRYMFRCWKQTAPQNITIYLGTLDKKPEIVEATAQQYIGRAI